MRARTISGPESGVALVTIMVIIALAAILIGALSMRAVNQSRQIDQFVDFKGCLNGVDAAYVACKSDLENGGSGELGLGTWTPPTGAFVPALLPSFDDSAVNPLRLTYVPGCEYMSYASPWISDGNDNNLDGVVDDPSEADFVTIYAMARQGGNVRRAEAVLQGTGYSVWDNAIFAGDGQSGGIISGHVDIHGSVHLLGDSLLNGSVAMALIGNSGVYNNYDGCPADLLQRVPALPTTTINGETVQTLNAEFRVRKGLVSVSGSSLIGAPDRSGNNVKETLDATFVNDGWTGNKTRDDGDRGDPSVVNSDNGWDEAYDMGDGFRLPMLTDDWRDPQTGETVLNPSTGVNYSHTQYFNEELAGEPYAGDLTIRCNQDFYYNASQPSDSDPSHRLPSDNYLYFNAGTNLMEINGQIEVDGDMTFDRGNGNDRTINYTGRAAILVHGDVHLETSLLAVNANGSTVGTFPVNNIIGIMADEDMYIGTTSQLSLMGAFYAQGKIAADKQSTIMGTFVSTYFDLGRNVPAIYQVPTLADNLPEGMIGAYAPLHYSEVSWRELGS